jgi:hypothetical protein
MFWALGGRGYTTNLDNAEVFSHEDAQRYADRREHFIPLSKARVDAVATVRVDMQYLKLNVDFSAGVIVQRHCGSYDGNDIYFDNGSGSYTADYGNAKIYQDVEALKVMANQTGAALSKSFLDSICRRTVQAENINHRKMITAAGIKYQKPRQRKDSGKTRHNCPVCAKFVWAFNPYHAPYCSFECAPPGCHYGTDSMSDYD